jgi:cardiolipin synthase
MISLAWTSSCSTPGQTNRITFILDVSAITFVEYSVHLTNSYFVPDEQTVKALTDAAGRCVVVKIILPGTTDLPLALYAGQYYYINLLELMYDHFYQLVTV